ncbi:hypothetical protein U9M48_044697 [Paspalum notatum var. saurae]|uniref:Uncharacterized protein n=1 Tax=Paspalum notatum var. saurae TaxID=547442 RepID=A0AAQ3UZU3_PASNO
MPRRRRPRSPPHPTPGGRSPRRRTGHHRRPEAGSPCIDASPPETAPNSRPQQRASNTKMLRHAKKAFNKSRSRSKGSDGTESSTGSLFRGTVHSRQRHEHLLRFMEEQAQEQEVQVEAPAEEEHVEADAEEEQVVADAEEEAAADAELLALGVVNPMQDGVEVGGPSSSANTIRFRKTVSIRPRCNPEARSVIRPSWIQALERVELVRARPPYAG